MHKGKFLPSGVTRLSSPLASNQLAVLPGRVRDCKAHFLIQAYSAFPRPHLFSLRESTIIVAVLCWVSKDLTRTWVTGNVNPFPSPRSVLYQPRCIVPTAKESPTTTHHHHLTVCCSTSMPTEQHHIIQCRSRQHRLFPINIICRYSKLQSQLLSGGVW